MLRERIRWKKEQEDELNSQFQSINNQEKVTRIFKVTSFGICNSDCPANMPTEARMNPVFTVNSNGTFIKANTTYLVCHSRNLVFSFGNEPLTYNPKEAYSICVLSNGKLYTCDKELLAKCLASKQNKIPVQEISADVSDSYELKKALGI